MESVGSQLIISGNVKSMKAHPQQEVHSTPPELRCVNQNALELYVRQRMKSAFEVLHEEMLVRLRSVPQALETIKMVQDAADDMMGQMSPVVEAEQPVGGQKYKLKFSHECRALGCMELKCDLCEANPRRRCQTNFDKKYFKGDILKAKCGGSIYVQIVDAETEERVDARDMDVVLEMCILDGNRYDHLFPDGVPHGVAKKLDMCSLLTGTENRPLLLSHDRTANKAHGLVVVPLQDGAAFLPDLSVQYSSEALLSGRRPPFRLMVRIHGAGSSAGTVDASAVVPGVSDGFVVASGRSRLAQKKHIPSVDDPVSRLENMGKERVKKLKDLHETAQMMGVELLDGAHWTVTKVGDFQRLAKEADKNGHLRQKMLHILKMSEKAWDETKDHALMAVTNDTRMRAWYRQGREILGLVYSCYLGETELERAVALIEGEEVHLKEHLKPAQRKLVRDLEKEAKDCWWHPGHPGWTFYPFDSEAFKQSPGLLKTSKDFNRSPMGMDRADATMIQINGFGALPGRPIVPLLQSVPMSSGLSESFVRDGEELGESRKRRRVDGIHQPGGPHKRHSPFEERERQLKVVHPQASKEQSIPPPKIRMTPPPTPFCYSGPFQHMPQHHLEERSESNRPQRLEKAKASPFHSLRPNTRPSQQRIITGFEKSSVMLEKKFKILKAFHVVESGTSEGTGPQEHRLEKNHQKMGRFEGGQREMPVHTSHPHVLDLTGQSTGGSLCEGSAGSRPGFSVRQPPSASDLSMLNLTPTAQNAYDEDRRIYHISSSSIGGGSRLTTDQDNCNYRTAHTEKGSVTAPGKMHRGNDSHWKSPIHMSLVEDEHCNDSSSRGTGHVNGPKTHSQYPVGSGGGSVHMEQSMVCQVSADQPRNRMSPVYFIRVPANRFDDCGRIQGGGKYVTGQESPRDDEKSE